MDFESILIAIVTGLAASFIFLSLISQLKPKIAISPIIAYKDTLWYRIKVINRTPHIIFFRDGRVLNVKGRLELVTPKYPHQSNNPQESEELDQHPLFTVRRIDLVRDEIFELGPLDKKDKYERYAYRFITKQNLMAEWKEKPDGNEQFIRFTIIATDALSNFSEVHAQEYHDRAKAFQKGNFEVGNTFEISPG